MQAAIQCVAYHLPEERLDNDALASIYPGWSAEKIHEKTGVRHRHIAREDETAADLAFIAADRLLRDNAVDRESIDYLLFCTQEPDYFLPSSSCLLQQRLGLPKSCGAIDVNQGCSGYVYSLGVAKGLIESGQARNVLVLTGDTYSKLIHPLD
jgi:3-oxoacyl-[acyl-carrier-protein] synthase-3